MKMIMIVYNEAVDMEVMEALEDCCLRNYTKLEGVFGKGEASGTHLGTDVWPGRNHVLYIALQDGDVSRLLDRIGKLRTRFAKEGIKAFVWPLDEVM